MTHPSKDLLAEAQLSFLLLLVVHNFEGFEQWKRILHLVCFAQDASRDPAWQPFYLEFLVILRQQLDQIPQDFFVDLISQDSFLRDCMKVWRR